MTNLRLPHTPNPGEMSTDAPAPSPTPGPEGETVTTLEGELERFDALHEAYKKAHREWKRQETVVNKLVKAHIRKAKA